MENESKSLLVFKQMAVYTQPSLAAIYGSIDTDTGELIGSGTFINLRGNPYLLTAGHIMLKSKDYVGLAYSRSDATRPASISQPYHVVNDRLDLCLVRIDPDIVHGSAIVPLSVSKLSRTSSDIRNEILFVHEYPAERKKFFKYFTGMVPRSLPSGAILGKTAYDWFDDKIHFAVRYPVENSSDEKMAQPVPVIPGGLSGAAVWSTNLYALGSLWKPDAASIVGIVHHFDDRTQSLVATRIEAVRVFLISCLRREFAYHRWEKRGSPFADDLNDWFAACEEIIDV